MSCVARPGRLPVVVVIALGLVPRGPAASAAEPSSTPAAAVLPPSPGEVARAAGDDPMLAPLARPPVEIASWPEARRLLAARAIDLRLAEAALGHADAQWRQALAALLPDAQASLALTDDLLDQTLPGPQPTDPVGSARVSVSVPVVDVAAWRGRAAASASRRAARAALDDARRDLDQQLADTLVAVLAAERIAELNRTGLRLALERLSLSDKGFRLGAATELDVIRIQQDVAVARSAVIAGDEQVRRAREALGLAIGTGTEIGVAPGFAVDGLAGSIGARCRRLGHGEERADLVAARARLDAASLRRAQARAAYFPTLSVASNLDVWTQDPDGITARAWTLAAVLTLPIYDGGFRGAAIADQAAFGLEAAAALEGTDRAVRQDVARARRGQAVARELVLTATQARDLALRLDDMTRRSFTIGRATSVDLVQSASTLRLAELTLAQREFELQRARVAALLVEARCDA